MCSGLPRGSLQYLPYLVLIVSNHPPPSLTFIHVFMYVHLRYKDPRRASPPPNISQKDVFLIRQT